jgi:hypothetical protein
MIIGISGRKQAGKNTVANILHGIILKQIQAIEDWNIGANGELNVLTTNANGESGWGIFDVSRKDNAFVQYAEHNMWPYVKLYSFADTLKWMCTDLFDIPYECVWGTNEQKNQPQEHLLWENMPGVITPENAWKIFHTFNRWNYHNLTQEEINILDEKIKIQFSPQDFNPYNPTWCVFPDKGIFVHRSGPMTAREFMQYMGTDLMRKMYEPIWVNACIKKIQREQSILAIVADVRFPNEANAIAQAGGTLLRLTRNILDDNHESETALDDYPFTNIIKNDNESIYELMTKVKSLYLNLVKPLYLN